jgi:subtilisin family serine protease/subtilisin-like proprotein convertase family protein
MRKRDFGRYLPRGGQKLKVEKVEDAFTAVLPEPADAIRLRQEEAVQSVEPLSRSVVRVTVGDGGAPRQVRDELMDKLRAEKSMVVHHEYAAADSPSTTYQITDKIIVQLKPDTAPERVQEIFDEIGVVIKKQYPRLGLNYLVVVTDAADANPVKVANKLEGYREVEYAEPNLVNQFVQFAFPADELFSSQWHLFSKNIVAPDIDPHADANIFEAWDITRGSRDVVVAVLDDGFELSHPDFQGAGKIVEAVDFTGNDQQPLPGSGDYHGTPCAGVAVAEENGQGCVGVAPGCALMPVRFPLGAHDAWLIEIFEYVSARAHVASCSWGMVPGDFELHSAVRDTFANLIRTGGKDGRGLAIVFAAGNYDAPLRATVSHTIRWLGQNQNGQWQIFTATGRIVNGYAAHPDVIAVSACTSLKRKSLYSNWGPEISVTAPSNNFDPTSFSPLPGRGITTVDNEEFGEDFTPGKRYTNSFGGTSSATPLVSGVVALVKSANLALTAPEIKQILEQTAERIEDDSSDALYGFAKGTYQNGHSDWFGHGRVHALHAVEEAVRRRPGEQTAGGENATLVPIPDFPRPGITSTIDVGASGRIAGVEVSIDLKHSWIGDLQVTLTSPAGTRAVLHNRSGGSQDDIRRTFSLADTPALGAFTNQEARGIWTLAVVDRAARDTGRLERWALEFSLATVHHFHAASDEVRGELLSASPRRT